MTNAALLERPDNARSVFSLTGSGAPPQLAEGQIWILLRIYGENGITHQFAIQDGSQFLDMDKNPLSLAPGTYAKCYNWSDLYSVDQSVDAYNPRLSWIDDDAPGAKVRADYVTLKWTKELLPDDRLVLFRHWENDRIVDSGVAKQRGNKLYRADGTQITEAVSTIEIGSWFNQKIMEGTLDIRDSSLNNMGWTRPIMDELWEAPQTTTAPETPHQMPPRQRPAESPRETSQAPSTDQGSRGRTVNITFYYIPHESDSRFASGAVDILEEGRRNGAYMDRNGTYWRYTGPEPHDFSRANAPITQWTEDRPRANHTLAVPHEWQEKWIVLVRDGRVLASGHGEDSGGAFTSGSGKIDVYTGEGQAAYEAGYDKHFNTGTATAYFFDSQADMNSFISRKGWQ
ncbi:Uncharacterised protein [Candidatus Burarchaeum australiense]|nr:Uncharacterised protein [Candidatus Burarchaeum australiense]